MMYSEYKLNKLGDNIQPWHTPFPIWNHSEVRGGGREEQPHLQGAASRAQECWDELLHVQGQEGGCEEIPLVQGKEQRLRFAGAAVKRDPTSKVRETQVRR